MTAQHPTQADAATWLEHALTLLTLRLRHEVALHRTLRGTSGKEEFAGLLLNGEEAEAMLAEMAGLLQVSGSEVSLQQIVEAERAHFAKQAVPGTIWHQLRAVFGLDDVALDLILLAAAPAIDPRFGRVFGFLNDDLTRRYLTPAVALRLLDRHHLDLSSFRNYLADDGLLVRNALLSVGPERPLVEAPLRLDDALVDQLLRDAPADRNAPGPGVWVVGAYDDLAPSSTMEAWARTHSLTLATLSVQAALAHNDLLKHIRNAARDALLAGELPCLCGFDQLPPPTCNASSPCAHRTRWSCRRVTRHCGFDSAAAAPGFRGSRTCWRRRH